MSAARLMRAWLLQALLVTALLVAALLAPAGCDGCGEQTETSQLSASATAAAAAAPERWMLGAVDPRNAVALPPPCQPVSALRAAIERPTQVQASRRTLAQIIGVQGPLMALGQGTPRHDAAGIYHMDHGRAPVTGLRWPAFGGALAARASSADAWLVAYQAERGTRLWRAGSEHTLSQPVKDLWCGRDACGLLLRGDAGEASVRVGPIAEPVEQWHKMQLSHEQIRSARAAALLAADAEQPGATVAFVDDLRVRVVEQRGEQPAEVRASMQIPHGAIDLVASPQPAALAYSGPMDARGCSAAAAGVLLIPAQGQAVTLRSPLPPSEGHLSPLQGGWLVTWRSPLRCESRQQLLYAAVVDAGGRAVAPVTSVTEAESYAVASRGDEVALWLVQDRTITWLRWRCSLKPD